MVDISKIQTNRIDGLDIILEEIVQPGDVCYSFRNEKKGWILCDGRAVSRTDYSDLFEAIGTQYGEGDGTTTFNVPNLSGRFLQMDTSKAIGTYVEAGLPNITGYFGTVISPSGNGCFTSSTYGSDPRGGGGYSFGGITLNASYSSSIYGNSTTVQPPAVIVNYFIKY